MKRYLIIVEQTSTRYSASFPNVSGCGSTGQTREEVERNIQEAIAFEIQNYNTTTFRSL
jgi:predicted RNase H-like HicB family nuclease